MLLICLKWLLITMKIGTSTPIFHYFLPFHRLVKLSFRMKTISHLLSLPLKTLRSIAFYSAIQLPICVLMGCFFPCIDTNCQVLTICNHLNYFSSPPIASNIAFYCVQYVVIRHILYISDNKPYPDYYNLDYVKLISVSGLLYPS